MPTTSTEHARLYSSQPLPVIDDGPSQHSLPHSTLASRRRSKTESVVSATSRRPASSEWTDVDTSPQPPRRSKHTSRRPSETHRNPQRDPAPQQDPESDPRFYHPRLGQIVEGAEGRSSHGRGSDPHRRHQDDLSLHRRPGRRRTGPSSPRTETVLPVSPSLLSVLSGLTGVSEQTSSSSNTITQQSYDRAHSVDPTDALNSRGRRSGADTMDEANPAPVNVFEYMEEERSQHNHDDQREPLSSSSSNYEASDGGSSEIPGSPSSQSTFPSPANTRNGSLNGGSVADLRRKFDQFAPSGPAARGSSPAPSLRTGRSQPSVSDVAENEEDDDSKSDMAPEVDHTEHRRPVSPSSQRSYPATHHFRPQRDLLPVPQPELRFDHTVGMEHSQYRSRSVSSAGSLRSQNPYAHSTALQRYDFQQTAPTPPPYQPPMAHNENVQHFDVPPHAPEPPVLGQRNVLGYEKLALELASARSSVQPLYRKFDYLNHRILLHLQDEISELEVQLRQLDQHIAQCSQAAVGGTHMPASRRGEEYYGNSLHHGRKELLGRIFLKIEQYNRAMSAYGSMNLDSRPAEGAQVAQYRAWMQQHAPIHEAEATFLLCEDDLISPSQRQLPQGHSSTPSSPWTNLLSWLPAAVLLLHLLLIVAIPTVMARVVVTTMMALSVATLATTTQIGSFLPTRDWLLCGAIYSMLMIAVASLTPCHEA